MKNLQKFLDNRVKLEVRGLEYGLICGSVAVDTALEVVNAYIGKKQFSEAYAGR